MTCYGIEFLIVIFIQQKISVVVFIKPEIWAKLFPNTNMSPEEHIEAWLFKAFIFKSKFSHGIIKVLFVIKSL